MASLIAQTHTEDIVSQTILEKREKNIPESSAIMVEISQIRVNRYNQALRKIFQRKTALEELAG